MLETFTAQATVLHGAHARRLRERYIARFVDTSSAYFRDNIGDGGMPGDRTTYSGYLWDTLRHVEVITQQELLEALAAWHHTYVYVFWDLHSEQKIRIPHYWKFSKDAVLRCRSADLSRVLGHDADAASSELILPEDLYIFDDTAESSLITTHEYVPERYCLRTR